MIPRSVVALIGSPTKVAKQKCTVRDIIQKNQKGWSLIVLTLKKEDRPVFDYAMLWEQQQFLQWAWESVRGQVLHSGSGQVKDGTVLSIYFLCHPIPLLNQVKV